MITYKQQYDKLTRAYIAGEVNPYICTDCFVGNLLNGTNSWVFTRYCYRANREESIRKTMLECDGMYTPDQILALEENFMNITRQYGTSKQEWSNPTAEMEEGLFRAFVSTLEMLKKIHESKEEVIDDAPVFEKRKPLAYV